MDDKIAGTLYGIAIGDALGMPSELWSRKKVQDHFGFITEFLNGPEENEVARNFSKGQFTDDTQQALIIIDSLVDNDFVVSEDIIGTNLLKWAEGLNAFENNILGPSSLAALIAFKNGEITEIFSKKALTNGAAMRIPPIGVLFASDDYENLIHYVTDINKITHSTDVSIAGASMVANAVSAAYEDKGWDDMIASVMRTGEIAMEHGEETFSASLMERTRLGIAYSKETEDDDLFSKKIYDTIGAGTSITESVPAALAIAYRTRNVKDCAIICANLGGDTDTIGAMATAICGAKEGYKNIDVAWTDIINQNNTPDLMDYTAKLETGRNKLI